MLRLGSGPRRVGVLVVPVLVVLGALLLFGSGGGDDSHITWWVVDELTRTGKIVNLNGDVLEQSSSLGLVLFAAALRLLIPIATPQLGVLLSLGALGGTCWLTGHLARRLAPILELPASLLVASSGPLVYWATSGMETSLAAFATVWLLDAIARLLELPRTAARGELMTWRLGGNLLAASAWFVSVRPENPLLLAATLATTGSLCLLKTVRERPGEEGANVPVLIGGAALAVAPGIALFLFRRLMFHEWFPHPVSAKAGGGARWGQGFAYLLDHSLQFQPALLLLLPLSALFLLWLSVTGRSKPVPTVLAAHGVFGLLFVLSSGGDWMSCGRFLAPLLPVWWLTVLGAAHFVARDRQAWLVGGALALVAANLTFLVRLAHGGGTNGYPLTAALKLVPAARAEYGLSAYPFLELANKSHLRDAILAEELKRVVKQVATITPGKIWLASGQAGGAPYHLFSAFPDKLRFIDFWGLTNSEARPCLPAKKLKHSSLGVALTPELLYQYRDVVLRDCGVPMADIVFNTGLRAGTRRGLEQRGYTVIYFQHGAMPNYSRDSWLRGGTSIDAYIAVRRELAERLQLQYREVRWNLTG
ncbi:MAG: hypothetical protein WDO69_24045 [Pseudomonadota bacterium]